MEMKRYIDENMEDLLKTFKELCGIPAPSHFEHKRAEYCKNWLEAHGAAGVYIDEALNVVFSLNCGESDDISVFTAHTDTVFPDTEPLPYDDDGRIVHCPGAGDDTASVAILLYTVKYFIENGIKPENGILFVCNSCEEGLGNLKGTRQLFRDYEGRIGRFISFDGNLGYIADDCAGSHRYEVEVTTPGGHSFGNFGAPNAINELAKLITRIYDIKVPEAAGQRTTYNVGGIEGGTSVNTIAQRAKMLCEYRSTDRECLTKMNREFEKIFREAESDNVKIGVTKIGDRPCSAIDNVKMEALKQIVAPIHEAVTGTAAEFESSSTDCNIPLSMGIPALCIGVYTGGGAHTREEWMDKSSFVPGLEFAIRTVMAVSKV